MDQKPQELNRPLEADPRRNKLMDNLLREYAGTHYKYDERGNLVHRLQNGAHAHFTWDLFDRLASYSDDKLKVDFAYDALGRRLYKNSVAHYWDRPEAGTGWNQMQRAKRQRDLGCGFTLFGWDGDTLAWESSPPRDDGDTGRTVHYLYEPGSFVPVAQALRKRPIVLHRQPDWRQREYDFDQDPLWQTTMPPQAFDTIAWYHCDHLGTPMELTDPHGNVAWAGQYKAWGEVREERSEWAKQHGLSNPIRFQGQYHDHETGLHYNRHRYYDTRGARFICKDPISYAGGLNQYVHAPNPISWIDPLGLAKECCCGAKGLGNATEAGSVFTQQRNFWSKDPIQFSGNKVYQRNDLFDPNLQTSWREGGKVITGSNAERMASGRAPIGVDGKSVNLHHMTRTQSGPIAEMTQSFHQTNSATIHINPNIIPSGSDRAAFDKWKVQYWKQRPADFRN